MSTSPLSQKRRLPWPLSRQLLIPSVAAFIIAPIAFLALPTTYASIAVIELRPPAALPTLEQFTRTQNILLTSPRCITAALNSPQWLSVPHHSNTPADVEYFRSHLSLAVTGITVRITFSDPDPQTAAAATAALVDAYQHLVIDMDPNEVTQKIAALQSLSREYQDKLAASVQSIAKIASPYSPETLDSTYKAKMMDVEKTNLELKYARQSLADWQMLHPNAPRQTAETDRSALASLQTRLQLRQAAFDQTTAETNDLSKRINQIHEEQQNQSQLKSWLSDTQKNIDELRTADNNLRQPIILSPGNPATPLPTAKLPLTAFIAFLTFLLTATIAPRRPL